MNSIKMLMAATALVGFGAVAGTASAQSLTTTFAGGNNFHGNIFDITTGANAITLNSVLLNFAGPTANLEFYYRPGTATGFQDSSAGWTLFSTNTDVASAGDNTGSLVDTTDLTFAANSRYGLYFTRTDGGTFYYTNGTEVGDVAATNADLTVYQGYGKSYPFASTFAPRIVNATFNYTVGTTGAVPEPATWAMMLMGFGAIGVGLRRRKSSVRTSVRFA